VGVGTMDDLLNFIPARISALLLVIAAPLAGCSASGAVRITLRDRLSHPSPTAAPEAAAAGALGVRLGGRHAIAGFRHGKSILAMPCSLLMHGHIAA